MYKLSVWEPGGNSTDIYCFLMGLQHISYIMLEEAYISPWASKVKFKYPVKARDEMSSVLRDLSWHTGKHKLEKIGALGQ